MEEVNAGDEREEIYSVWAIPPADVTSRLKNLMSSLRSEFGGPAFEPHVTVVGDLRLSPSDALRRLRSAAATLAPYTARVSAVSRGRSFYQCIYLLIDPTPEAMGAGEHCWDRFGYQSPTPYMPHLSLVYGDLTDEEKERACERAAAIDEEICSLSFQISEIALYKTDTEDKSLVSWEKVAACDLNA